jgi:3-isopropylmalate/(R)-2-methylmalate dehydratase small subunit
VPVTAVAAATSGDTRWRVLEGLDDIGLTLRHVEQIDEFERRRAGYKPKTLPAKVASSS